MIRRAEMRDLPQVAELIRESFDATLRPYMVYAQHGAAVFLAAYVRHPLLSADRLLLVAEDETGAVRGFAEFRIDGAHPAHLSYICVHASMRGRGVAEKMIRYSVAENGTRDIDLYVFADNAPALALYRRLGFSVVGETTWFARTLPAADCANESACVLNLPAALAAFDHFGFCEFQIGTAEGVERVGRIGSSVLRCASASSFTDNGLLACLAAAFPEAREALMIGTDDPGIGRAVNRSIRMIGAL